ncbi:hypothetical protein C2E23DRAFT_902317, partial [Lenzites betulinus]
MPTCTSAVRNVGHVEQPRPLGDRSMTPATMDASEGSDVRGGRSSSLLGGVATEANSPRRGSSTTGSSGRGLDDVLPSVGIHPDVERVNARYIAVRNCELQAIPRLIDRKHLDSLFSFHSAVHTSHWEAGLARAGDLIVKGTPSTIIPMFSFWRVGQLRVIAVGHGIRGREKMSQESLIHV